MGKIFINDNQLQDWVDASEEIKERFGIEKALGYLIGEKFYNLVGTLHAAKTMVRAIDDKRKEPEYNHISIARYNDREIITNFNDMYESRRELITEVKDLLGRFVVSIMEVYTPHAIRQYFESHPRLGVYGHVISDEQYEFLLEQGAIEHSLETEVEDALIFGDMLKYFGMTPDSLK